MKNKVRVAWISAPAFICVDKFIVPEVSKYMDVTWYIIAKENEVLDFEEQLEKLIKLGKINCKILRHKERNCDFGIIIWFIKFLKNIKREKYDLIYQVMIGMPFYMPLFRFYLGCKNVLIGIHNVKIPQGGSNYWINKLYVSFCIKSFKYFQTFSNDQKEQLLKIAPNKHCTSVPFVSMDYGEIDKSVKENKDVITFLNFGIIRDYKRIDVLINAAQRAYEITGKMFKVIIAGSCNDWEKYQNKIKYQELFELIIKRIDDNDVAKIFERSDYFVLPYQYIAQSGSAIIAINYDMPIIASKLPAFEEYIKDKKTGFLINPADVEDLTKTMIYILNNHFKIYNKLVNNVNEFKLNNFTDEKVAEKYINNFNIVLKKFKEI